MTAFSHIRTLASCYFANRPTRKRAVDKNIRLAVWSFQDEVMHYVVRLLLQDPEVTLFILPGRH